MKFKRKELFKIIESFVLEQDEEEKKENELVKLENFVIEKNEAKIINKHPKFTNPFEKKTIAISPHNKFKIVKKLAIFNIFEFIDTILKHYFL